MDIIDNWAKISGEVAEIRPGHEFITVVVKVSTVMDYEDFPNLMTWAKGQLITVEVPRSAKIPEVGETIDWVLQIVSPGTSAPHPSCLAS